MRMHLAMKGEKRDHLFQQKCGKHWSGMQMILQHQEWLDNIHLMRIFSIWDYSEKSMGYFFISSICIIVYLNGDGSKSIKARGV